MNHSTGFRGLLQEYISKEARPIDKLGHQYRLYSLARRIGSGLAYDDDVLFAAAWLHDLGVFLGHRPQDPLELAHWDNVRYAVEKAPAILDQCGFPIEKNAAVIDAIRQHLPDSRPEAIESVLLHDADILEQLGSIGILRIVSKVGRDTRYPTFTDAVRTLRSNCGELPAKLIHCRSQRMATPRVTLMKTFFRELDSEAIGELH